MAKIVSLLKSFYLPVLLGVLAIFWAGMILGVAFIATPAKFLAPSLTLEAAIEVGQATFHVFNKIECGFGAACFFLGYLFKRKKEYALLMSACILLLIETVYLLPSLDRRIALLLAGEEVPASKVHLFYVLCEIGKFVSLLVAGAMAIVRLREGTKEPSQNSQKVHTVQSAYK